MYISTAYANCIYEKIEEKFYQTPFDYNGVISLVTTAKDDKKLESITPRYLIKIIIFTWMCLLDKNKQNIHMCPAKPLLLNSWLFHGTTFVTLFWNILIWMCFLAGKKKYALHETI